MPVQPVNLMLMVPVMGKMMLNSKMPGCHLRHKSGMLRCKTTLWRQRPAGVDEWARMSLDRNLKHLTGA